MERRGGRKHTAPWQRDGADEDDRLCRSAQPIEDRACGGAVDFLAGTLSEAVTRLEEAMIRKAL